MELTFLYFSSVAVTTSPSSSSEPCTPMHNDTDRGGEYGFVSDEEMSPTTSALFSIVSQNPLQSPLPLSPTQQPRVDVQVEDPVVRFLNLEVPGVARSSRDVDNHQQQKNQREASSSEVEHTSTSNKSTQKEDVSLPSLLADTSSIKSPTSTFQDFLSTINMAPDTPEVVYLNPSPSISTMLSSPSLYKSNESGTPIQGNSATQQTPSEQASSGNLDSGQRTHTAGAQNITNTYCITISDHFTPPNSNQSISTISHTTEEPHPSPGKRLRQDGLPHREGHQQNTPVHRSSGTRSGQQSSSNSICMKYLCEASGCTRSYLHKKDLIRHMRMIHNSSPHLMEATMVVVPPRPNVCGIDGCVKSYIHHKDLIRHQRQVHFPAMSHLGSIQKRYPCDYPQCNKSYIHKKDLIRHKRLFHTDTSAHPTVPEPIIVEEDEESMGETPSHYYGSQYNDDSSSDIMSNPETSDHGSIETAETLPTQDRSVRVIDHHQHHHHHHHPRCPNHPRNYPISPTQHHPKCIHHHSHYQSGSESNSGHSMSFTEVGVSTRSQEVGVSTRSQEVGVSTRNQEVSVSTRSQEVGVSTRSQEVGVSTRSQYIGISTRSQEVGVSTRNQESSISAINPDLSASTITQEVGVSTKSQEVGVSTKTQEVGVSTRSREMGVSTRSQEMGVSARPYESDPSSRSHESLDDVFSSSSTGNQTLSLGINPADSNTLAELIETTFNHKSPFSSLLSEINLAPPTTASATTSRTSSRLHPTEGVPSEFALSPTQETHQHQLYDVNTSQVSTIHSPIVSQVSSEVTNSSKHHQDKGIPSQPHHHHHQHSTHQHHHHHLRHHIMRTETGTQISHSTTSASLTVSTHVTHSSPSSQHRPPSFASPVNLHHEEPGLVGQHDDQYLPQNKRLCDASVQTADPLPEVTETFVNPPQLFQPRRTTDVPSSSYYPSSTMHAATAQTTIADLQLYLPSQPSVRDGLPHHSPPVSPYSPHYDWSPAEYYDTDEEDYPLTPDPHTCSCGRSIRNSQAPISLGHHHSAFTPLYRHRRSNTHNYSTHDRQLDHTHLDHRWQPSSHTSHPSRSHEFERYPPSEGWRLSRHRRSTDPPHSHRSNDSVTYSEQTPHVVHRRSDSPTFIPHFRNSTCTEREIPHTLPPQQQQQQQSQQLQQQQPQLQQQQHLQQQQQHHQPQTSRAVRSVPRMGRSQSARRQDRQREDSERSLSPLTLQLLALTRRTMPNDFKNRRHSQK